MTKATQPRKVKTGININHRGQLLLCLNPGRSGTRPKCKLETGKSVHRIRPHFTPLLPPHPNHGRSHTFAPLGKVSDHFHRVLTKGIGRNPYPRQKKGDEA
ncbi:MAG: hypothetical protein EBV83_06230 [Verrucomicrobia bacterium]|nr:hypothetical protein [Verrucomicrobiota bacterium]